LIPQAYFFMENPTKGPSTQGKSPCGRDLKRNQRIQDAHTNIIGTKGAGIHTVTGIGVSTYVICYSDTNLVEKHNINATHCFLPKPAHTGMASLSSPGCKGCSRSSNASDDDASAKTPLTFGTS
jgi:hypothetical protein